MLAPYLAEAIGTFTLIFIGAGSVCTNAAFHGAHMGLTGIALAHGLAIMTMVYAFGHVSGGHFNPAVTAGMLATRRIEPMKAIGYWIAQLSGAAVAGFLLSAVFARFPDAVSAALGTPDLEAAIGVRSGLAIEMVLTFLLVTSVCGLAVDDRAPRGFAGLGIGLVITMDVLMGGPLTGAAMNPARHFGPAIATGHWANAWIYWVGPLLGGVTAAVLYGRVFLRK